MSIPIVYGIPNCDTIKKARKWLEVQGINYQFHDYRKQGLDTDWLEATVNELGWEAMINKRGLSWRKLDDDAKATMNINSAIQVMLNNPAIIKRPLLVGDCFKQLGFDPETWERLLK